MQKLTLSIADYPDLPNAKLVHFEGDFDGYATESIKDLESAINECAPQSTFVFDFAKLNYLNSFAIGQLVTWHNNVNTKGGKILVVGTNKNVEDIFSVLGIGNIFKIYATMEEMKQGEA